MKTIIWKQCILGMKLLLLFNMKTVWTQQNNRTVKEDDYEKWGTLGSVQISEKGNWSTFNMSYSTTDTVFLINNLTRQQISIAGIREKAFMKENTFLWLKNNNLSLLDLKTLEKTNIPTVTKYIVSQEKNLLITIENKNNQQQIVLRNIKGEIIKTIENTRNYSFDEEKNRMVYEKITDANLYLAYIDLSNPLSYILIEYKEAGSYKNFKWNSKGIVILSQNEKSLSTICYFDTEKKRLECLNNDLIPEEIDQTTNTLYLSNNAEFIYFDAKKKLINRTTNDAVEIWYGSDQLIYPIRKMKEERGYDLYTWVWNRRENTVKQITDEELPGIHYLSNANKLLLYNKYQNTTENKSINDYDVYLYDSKTAVKKRIIQEFDPNDNLFRNIAQTDDFVYYADNNWWLYNTKLETATNLTSSIHAEWDNKIIDEGYQQVAWGIAGIANDKKYIYLYDTYDIWKIDLKTLSSTKLTNGRETQQVFRFDLSDHHLKKSNYTSDIRYIDETKNNRLVINDLNTRIKSYSVLKPNHTIDLVLTSNNFLYTKLQQAKLTTDLIYLKESYNLPPELWYKKDVKAEPIRIYASNRHHYLYNWGTSELLHYTTRDGKKLKAALFYPPNYKEGNLYPVIVRIYENLSQAVKEYHNPSMYNTIGFNVSNLTQQGYVVVLPDIQYEKGFAGASATNSVVAVLNKLIDKGVTEKGKIGLIGQSFGGYQTNFILTQTDLFSAAVTGAGFFDLVKGYFTMNEAKEKTESWRYENHQFRIKKSFYDAPELYIKNSPLYHANRITTPILSWTGLKDATVSPEQTMTIYTALRRLNKNIVMLRYPEARHYVASKEDQIDLTKRAEQWFAFYLKNEQKSSWIK
ncbi:MAG: S9 family peptidase [Flavobacteriaceae bacterium]|nr:S9 family peptidase [Candidatus Onthonaster equi]